jgi:membrane protein DedA with SNARE-associated domain
VSALVERILAVNGMAIYLLVGGLVLAEDAIFVGFFVPGELAAIVGGVAASRGNASLVLLCVIVVVAAVVGDTIGYAIGSRYGDRLLETRVLRKRARRLDHARDVLRRRGGPAVFAGRFIAFLRAVMPFLAGTSHMPYRRFLAYNLAGGVVWGVGSVLLGYFAGNSYKTIERALGPATAAAVAVIVIAALIVWRVRAHRREARAEEAEPEKITTAR